MGLAWAAGGALLVLAPLWIRAGWEGRAELELADDAQVAEDTDGEIEHLGRAARWRLPLATHDETALTRLMEIGVRERARGSVGRQGALAAFREVRGALLATRAWGIPHREWFDEANTHIAELMAAQEAAYGTDIYGKDDPQGEHLRHLSQVPGPGPVRGNLTALAFVAWLGCSVGFVTRGLNARGRLRPRPALLWGGASLVLLVAWMVLLRHAG